MYLFKIFYKPNKFLNLLGEIFEVKISSFLVIIIKFNKNKVTTAKEQTK